MANLNLPEGFWAGLATIVSLIGKSFWDSWRGKRKTEVDERVDLVEAFDTLWKRNSLLEQEIGQLRGALAVASQTIDRLEHDSENLRRDLEEMRRLNKQLQTSATSGTIDTQKVE
jgi:predicted  nucleic acid-binding Zn-ribbon protein